MRRGSRVKMQFFSPDTVTVREHRYMFVMVVFVAATQQLLASSQLHRMQERLMPFHQPSPFSLQVSLTDMQRDRCPPLTIMLVL